MKRELKVAAIAAAVTLTLSGCASNSSSDSVASLPLETNQSETAIQIDQMKQSIEAAEKILASTQETELDWFATKSVNEAKQALAEAKEYYSEFELDHSEANSSSGFFSSKTNIQAAEEGIAKFNAHISKAKSIRAEVLTILEEAFSYRTQLQEIDAAKYYPTTARQLESELKRLVDDVANENTDDAINGQPKLVTKQRALEVKTVTKIYLSDAQKELKRLKMAKIGMHAPKTLSQAAAAVTAAKAFIAAEPRATTQIISKVDEAVFSLKHAEQIANVVKKLKAMPESDYERHVLSYEKILLNITKALGAEDMRDQPLTQQGRDLVQYIKDNLKNEQETMLAQQKLRRDLKDQQARAALLEEKVAKLSAQLTVAKQAAEAVPAPAPQAPVAAATPTKSAAVEAKVDTEAPQPAQPEAITEPVDAEAGETTSQEG
ncbi:hypothetical protein [Photobacterium atrarenae]|uniref:DNA repair protein n=1 Tax=Photobacterium atrarenae TaxID=865757 RepID=A0ABY5GI47_9GAMM|nr:hypothetical protein [Photobacterium atrarenae]UTV28465.1 hypothetical protein NNL38_04250 [Photobacterium atrarenae]